MKPKRLGVLLVVSGPSGTGKSTLISALRKSAPDLHFSVSCTTRAPRAEETNGIDYHFIMREEYDTRLGAGEFLEYAEVHGNGYGTLRSEVEPRLRRGNDVLLDIDVQGALRIREQAESDEFLARCLEMVFIGPPSFDVLEKRLRQRGTETEDAVQCRLCNAKTEMDHWQHYDYLVINKDLDNAVEDMKKLLDVMHKCTGRLEDSGFY